MSVNIIFAIIFAVAGVIPTIIAVWMFRVIIRDWDHIEYDGPIPLPRGIYIGGAIVFAAVAITMYGLAILCVLSPIAI